MPVTPATSAAQATPVVPTALMPGHFSVVPSAIAVLYAQAAPAVTIYPVQSASFCDCDSVNGFQKFRKARLRSTKVATLAVSPAEVSSVEPPVSQVPRLLHLYNIRYHIYFSADYSTCSLLVFLFPLISTCSPSAICLK